MATIAYSREGGEGGAADRMSDDMEFLRPKSDDDEDDDDPATPPPGTSNALDRTRRAAPPEDPYSHRLRHDSGADLWGIDKAGKEGSKTESRMTQSVSRTRTPPPSGAEAAATASSTLTGPNWRSRAPPAASTRAASASAVRRTASRTVGSSRATKTSVELASASLTLTPSAIRRGTSPTPVAQPPAAGRALLEYNKAKGVAPRPNRRPLGAYPCTCGAAARGKGAVCSCQHSPSAASGAAPMASPPPPAAPGSGAAGTGMDLKRVAALVRLLAEERLEKKQLTEQFRSKEEEVQHLRRLVDRSSASTSNGSSGAGGSGPAAGEQENRETPTTPRPATVAHQAPTPPPPTTPQMYGSPNPHLCGCGCCCRHHRHHHRSHRHHHRHRHPHRDLEPYSLLSRPSPRLYDSTAHQHRDQEQQRHLLESKAAPPLVEKELSASPYDPSDTPHRRPGSEDHDDAHPRAPAARTSAAGNQEAKPNHHAAAPSGASRRVAEEESGGQHLNNNNSSRSSSGGGQMEENEKHKDKTATRRTEAPQGALLDLNISSSYHYHPHHRRISDERPLGHRQQFRPRHRLQRHRRRGRRGMERLEYQEHGGAAWMHPVPSPQRDVREATASSIASSIPAMAPGALTTICTTSSSSSSSSSASSNGSPCGTCRRHRRRPKRNASIASATAAATYLRRLAQRYRAHYRRRKREARLLRRELLELRARHEMELVDIFRLVEEISKEYDTQQRRHRAAVTKKPKQMNMQQTTTQLNANEKNKFICLQEQHEPEHAPQHCAPPSRSHTSAPWSEGFSAAAHSSGPSNASTLRPEDVPPHVKPSSQSHPPPPPSPCCGGGPTGCCASLLPPGVGAPYLPPHLFASHRPTPGCPPHGAPLFWQPSPEACCPALFSGAGVPYGYPAPSSSDRCCCRQAHRDAGGTDRGAPRCDGRQPPCQRWPHEEEQEKSLTEGAATERCDAHDSPRQNRVAPPPEAECLPPSVADAGEEAQADSHSNPTPLPRPSTTSSTGSACYSISSYLSSRAAPLSSHWSTVAPPPPPLPEAPMAGPNQELPEAPPTGVLLSSSSSSSTQSRAAAALAQAQTRAGYSATAGSRSSGGSSGTNRHTNQPHEETTRQKIGERHTEAVPPQEEAAQEGGGGGSSVKQIAGLQPTAPAPQEELCRHHPTAIARAATHIPPPSGLADPPSCCSLHPRDPAHHHHHHHHHSSPPCAKTSGFHATCMPTSTTAPQHGAKCVCCPVPSMLYPCTLTSLYTSREGVGNSPACAACYGAETPSAPALPLFAAPRRASTTATVPRTPYPSACEPTAYPNPPAEHTAALDPWCTTPWPHKEEQQCRVTAAAAAGGCTLHPPSLSGSRQTAAERGGGGDGGTPPSAASIPLLYQQVLQQQQTFAGGYPPLPPGALGAAATTHLPVQSPPPAPPAPAPSAAAPSPAALPLSGGGSARFTASPLLVAAGAAGPGRTPPLPSSTTRSSLTRDLTQQRRDTIDAMIEQHRHTLSESVQQLQRLAAERGYH